MQFNTGNVHMFSYFQIPGGAMLKLNGFFSFYMIEIRLCNPVHIIRANNIVYDAFQDQQLISFEVFIPDSKGSASTQILSDFRLALSFLLDVKLFQNYQAEHGLPKHSKNIETCSINKTDLLPRFENSTIEYDRIESTITFSTSQIIKLIAQLETYDMFHAAVFEYIESLDCDNTNQIVSLYKSFEYIKDITSFKIPRSPSKKFTKLANCSAMGRHAITSKTKVIPATNIDGQFCFSFIRKLLKDLNSTLS